MKKTLCIVSAILLISLCGCQKGGELSSPQASQNSSAFVTEPDITIVYSSSPGETDEINSKYFSDISEAMQQTDTVMAYVDDTPVYKKYFLICRASLDKANSENLNTFTNEQEKLDYSAKHTKTDEELLNDLINEAIINIEAKKSGITVDLAAATESAKQDVEALKTNSPDFFERLLSAYNYTEDDFLNKIQLPGKINRFYKNKYRSLICPAQNYNNTEEQEKSFNSHIGTIKKNHAINIL